MPEAGNNPPPSSTLVLRGAMGLTEAHADLLWDLGTLGIWEVSAREWRASFASRDDAISTRLSGIFPGTSTSWEASESVDWAARFQSTLKPMAAGRSFAILPAPDQSNPWPSRLPIRLSPGMAFGTGEHFTTASCLRLLEEVEIRPSTLFDVGCGSGILAIGGFLLGADRVAACDTDAEAVGIALENAAANGASVEFRTGGPESFSERFDCVLANIQAEVLIGIMPVLRERVAPGGTLIVAGVLSERYLEVLASSEGVGFRLAALRTDGRWVSLRMRAEQSARG